VARPAEVAKALSAHFTVGVTVRGNNDVPDVVVTLMTPKGVRFASVAGTRLRTVPLAFYAAGGVAAITAEPPGTSLLPGRHRSARTCRSLPLT
jgi:hypothetical protein